MTSNLVFTKAVRTATKIKMAITGPSGSGKTYSALSIAKGITDKIALLDTEAASASLYSDIFNFDTITLSAPFEPKRFIEIIKAAEKAGYELLIIDSLSHSWSGEGGALQKKEQLDARSGRQNAFTNWASVKKEQNELKEAILQSKMHIIVTLRAKQEHALTSDGNKNKVEKLGMAPIAEPGLEYEYSILFELAMNHEAVAGKDRTGLFDGQIFKPTPQIGEKIKNWLATSTSQHVIKFIPDLMDQVISDVSYERLSEVRNLYLQNYKQDPQFFSEDQLADLKAISDYLKAKKLTTT
jgi:hypothetical protein